MNQQQSGNASTNSTRNGYDGQDASAAPPVYVPDPRDILSRGDPRYVDELMATQIERGMVQTSGQQSHHLVASYRQQQLDKFRVEQGMRMRDELIVDVAEGMQGRRAIVNYYQANACPEDAALVAAMVESANIDNSQMPRMAQMYFLRHYGMS